MRTIVAILFLSTFASTSIAKVVRFDIEQRADVLEGRAFGLAGGYEKISGRVHFAVDPALEPNLIITDIDKAPRNGSGLVEFAADFYILKPKDLVRGNGSLLLEVGNRGRKGLLSFFNLATGSADPSLEEHFGDGFLLRHGYTLLWVGWQWDTPERGERMRMYPPVATDQGKPIRGLVRSDFVVRSRELDHSLGDRNHIAYPVADPDAAENVLTVRDDVEAERHVVPRAQWKFARDDNGKVTADPRSVYLEGGFEPFKIYEVVYVSENPPLVGLGPGAIRDVVSLLKYDGAPAIDIDANALDRALAFGISQSGRLLRTFLYYGFNEDESHRRVFDGVVAHVAGGGRGSFNHRFAQASRDAHPYINFFHPTDIFPFTDRAQVDTYTGVSDGLLAEHDTALLPKVFYTNSSYEYWGRAASLIHTSIDAREDAKLMDNVRIYQFSGSQHGVATFPPTASLGQQKSNPLDYRWSMRALLVAMDRWVADGDETPASRYGRLEDNTLVSPENLDFPPIPGVDRAARVHKAYRAAYGDKFRSEGVVTQEPPEIGPAYPMMVPAVDDDGNEQAGIALPEHTVPLATYTGWNLFNAESGPTHVLSSMQGSFIPFPRTEAERERSGDPRVSIERRYASREHYLGLVADAALELIDDGYLLGEDLPAVLRQAGARWDYITSESSSSSSSR